MEIGARGCGVRGGADEGGLVAAVVPVVGIVGAG